MIPTIIVIAVMATLPQRYIILCLTTCLLASVFAPIMAGGEMKTMEEMEAKTWGQLD